MICDLIIVLLQGCCVVADFDKNQVLAVITNIDGKFQFIS